MDNFLSILLDSDGVACETVGMSDYTLEEMTAGLLDIRKRRNDASRDYRAETYRMDRTSGTTSADIDFINEAYSRLDDFAQLVVQIHDDVWDDFRRGDRCGVCGMTGAQSEAVGYDCMREC